MFSECLGVKRGTCRGRKWLKVMTGGRMPVSSSSISSTLSKLESMGSLRASNRRASSSAPFFRPFGHLHAAKSIIICRPNVLLLLPARCFSTFCDC